MTEPALQDEVVSNGEQQVITDDTPTDGIAPAAAQSDFVELSDEAQKKFNKLTWEKNEAKRKADALEKRISDLEASKPVEEVKVERPNSDLMYESPEEYNRKLSEAIRAEERQKATLEAQERLRNEQQQAQQTKQQADAQQRAESFNKKAIEAGLKPDAVMESANIVAAYEPSADLANYLLDDPKGPQMVDYLAKNQVELSELVQLNPFAAAAKLQEIKAKAVVAKKSVTNAPDPVQPINGGGNVESKDPFLNGVKFK